MTESGLQYEIISAGKGEKPTPLDTVTVHYHGTLIDGTVFDSSIERQTPATFPVNGVIAGWTEALQLMQVGAKYKLFIPADLAYGKSGAGRDIGPNSTLIFEVELLSIKGQEEKKSSGFHPVLLTAPLRGAFFSGASEGSRVVPGLARPGILPGGSRGQ